MQWSASRSSRFNPCSHWIGGWKVMKPSPQQGEEKNFALTGTQTRPCWLLSPQPAAILTELLFSFTRISYVEFGNPCMRKVRIQLPYRQLFIWRRVWMWRPFDSTWSYRQMGFVRVVSNGTEIELWRVIWDILRNKTSWSHNTARNIKQCGFLDISRPYRPTRFVTGIALLFCVCCIHCV
jgi:hypothetical protein